MFKKSFYSHIGANQPIVSGTVKLGSTKGRGSSTRMFNYCNQRSTNPSECINQFITITDGNSGVTPPPPPPEPTFEVLEDGFNLDVYSINLSGSTNLYVGGEFITNNSGTTTFNQLANWNIGSDSWSVVSNAGGGVGVSLGNVYSSVTTPNSRLYVGGSFQYAPDSNGFSYVYLQSIGIYNPPSSQWFSLNSTGSAAGVTYFNGTFYSYGIVKSVVYNSKNGYVYFGGYFNITALGTQLNYIASTDSNSTGSTPPIYQLIDTTVSNDVGVNGQVNQLSVDNNSNSIYYGRVYVCGTFTGNTSGSKLFRGVAVFEPSSPASTTNGSFLGLGIGLNVGGYGQSITVNPYSSNDIYIGGSFTSAQGTNGTVNCSNIVRHSVNSNTFGNYYYLGISPGDGVNGIVNAICCLSNGDVYVGGSFTSAIYGGNLVPATAYIARWRSSNSTWNALQLGLNEQISLNGAVYTITEGASGEIYIGGAFTQVNSTQAYRIIKYIP